jgi:peptide subunit release factor 1 (eRF1)
MSQNNHLYAPSFIALQELRKTLDKELKKPRTRNTPLIDLQSSPDGKDVAAEMAWIEAWLERKEDERERQRRKIMEEEDAEAARLLNFKLHEESGGLLEWYVFDG